MSRPVREGTLKVEGRRVTLQKTRAEGTISIKSAKRSAAGT